MSAAETEPAAAPVDKNRRSYIVLREQPGLVPTGERLTDPSRGQPYPDGEISDQGPHEGLYSLGGRGYRTAMTYVQVATIQGSDKTPALAKALEDAESAADGVYVVVPSRNFSRIRATVIPKPEFAFEAL